MSTHLWRVTAKRNMNQVVKGMSVEVIVRNTSRKPNQKEVIAAFDAKYGAGIAYNGMPVSSTIYFEMVEVK
ncbi:peptidase [Riemerella columbina]|uniref:peptidase n=1 Tax=Riemerella columbina TaxID=103810 RepID=UPI00266F83C0|nr:peptidase [Riemerella columbina]WKS95427.1 peptidase [Riemerella columbina]